MHYRLIRTVCVNDLDGAAPVARAHKPGRSTVLAVLCERSHAIPSGTRVAMPVDPTNEAMGSHVYKNERSEEIQPPAQWSGHYDFDNVPAHSGCRHQPLPRCHFCGEIFTRPPK